MTIWIPMKAEYPSCLDRGDFNLLQWLIRGFLGDIERHDCKKFAGDALYLCEEMRRLHDRLYANTSLPQIDISIFEDLEGCAQFSLDEIEEKEEAVIAQGKTVFRESMIQEQAFKSEAHLQHHKPAQIEGSVDAIIKVEDGDMEMSESAEGASRKRRCQ